MGCTLCSCRMAYPIWVLAVLPVTLVRFIPHHRRNYLCIYCSCIDRPHMHSSCVASPWQIFLRVPRYLILLTIGYLDIHASGCNQVKGEQLADMPHMCHACNICAYVLHVGSHGLENDGQEVPVVVRRVAASFLQPHRQMGLSAASGMWIARGNER